MKRILSFAAALCLLAAGAAFAQGSKPEEIDRVVAVVNADAITATELSARMRTVERQLRAQNIQMPPEDVLRSQVLERMIIDRAQVQLARESGLRIDDAQVDRAVAGIAQQNRLTLPQLRQRLEQDGINFVSFREDVRGEILIARLREREVDQRVVISEADIDALLAEQGPGTEATEQAAEFNLGHILLRVPENASAEQIARQRARGEDLLRQLEGGADFGRLAASFSDAPEAMSGGGLGWRPTDRLPELFVQAIQRLRPGQVSPLIRSPNGFHVLKVVDRRDAGGAKLGSAPVQQTHARHILIRQTELVPEVEALRRLREIRERVINGTARFEDMARQYSSDASASSGGDLGWVYEGDTVPEFARAMDELKPGEISEPVRSPFGWHLIQVLERRTDNASPERVRMQARQVLRERRSDEAYQEWVRQLRDRTYVEYRLE